MKNSKYESARRKEWYYSKLILLVFPLICVLSLILFSASCVSQPAQIYTRTQQGSIVPEVVIPEVVIPQPSAIKNNKPTYRYTVFIDDLKILTNSKPEYNRGVWQIKHKDGLIGVSGCKVMVLDNH